MADEITIQIEDRVAALLKAADLAAEDRVYTDADFRIDRTKTYVRLACTSTRLIDVRHVAGGKVLEVSDVSLSVMVFASKASAGGDPRRFALNEAAKIRAVIARNRTLKDAQGVPLAFRTLWQSQAAAADGAGESARAGCQNIFLVRIANLAEDPTKSLPQLAAEQD